MSCSRAQEFLEANELTVGERTDARKQRKGRDEALALAKSAEHVVVARGKTIVEFDMRTAPPDDDTLVAHLLGPTGNLKAPTFRHGKTLVVGFSEAAYRQVLGA